MQILNPSVRYIIANKRRGSSSVRQIQAALSIDDSLNFYFVENRTIMTRNPGATVKRTIHWGIYWNLWISASVESLRYYERML